MPEAVSIPAALARLLRGLMQDLPRRIEAAEEAARMTIEDSLDS
jgi:hypothetical protein